MRVVTALLALSALAACEVTPVDQARKDLYNLEMELWKNVTDPAWVDAGMGGDIELTKAFVTFANQMQAIKQPKRLRLKAWLWTKATEKLQIIEGMYVNFEKFVRKQAQPGSVPAPVREWLGLADSVLMDPKTSVSLAIKKLDGLLEHGDMFRVALQEDHPDVCDLQMSPHQLIYNMYNTISLAEIKGYAMMQFSWMLLRIYGKGNFTQEANLTRDRYAVRTAQIAASARAALKMASRGLHRCDPPAHKEGETYAELTELLQGYLENEVDMNPTGTCLENCNAYRSTKNYGCYQDDLLCGRQRTCQGRIFDCKYIESDMLMCPSDDNSSRRYDWIHYKKSVSLGTDTACKKGVTKVNSWWRWLFWHCSYCMCLCEGMGPSSDRFFSLRGAITETRANKIVTGIRLIKVDRVFHLQISEGTLGEGGTIIATHGWVPVQPIDITDPDFVEGVDFHTLTYESRAIDLDELQAPPGHILTGVRFQMLGAHLHFEIRSTPFNFTTGKLVSEKSQWISNDNTDGSDIPRRELLLESPDIPTRHRITLPVDSEHDQFIEFTHSDYDTDVAQSTVPFIDIQPLQPLNGTALLSGAGIIHKGMKGSGGFIAVKLFTYDYSKHIKAEKPSTSVPVEDVPVDMPVRVSIA